MGFVDMLLESAGDLSACLFGRPRSAPRGTGGVKKTASHSEHLKAMGLPASWWATTSVGIWPLPDNGDGARHQQRIALAIRSQYQPSAPFKSEANLTPAFSN